MKRRHSTFWISLVLAAALPLSLPAASEEAASGEAQQPAAFTDYIEMRPAFVTHVGEPSERIRYLKADVSLRVNTETARAAIETHMPRLRHELVMLFGEHADLDTLSSPEGQQTLRETARDRLNTVLEEQQTGETITDVLFSTFVIQR